MHKTYCNAEQEKITYQVIPSGRANVWLRGDATEVETAATTEGGEVQKSYEQDELYFTVDPKLVTKNQIEEDFDFFFKNVEDGGTADQYSLEEYKEAKHEELSSDCEEVITYGVDVTLSDGTVEHFALTQVDQINLIGKQVELSGTGDSFAYHCDGEPCKAYSRQDMTKICTEAISFITYQTTYVNSVFNWINGCTKASELAEITYGVEVPEKYKSDILKQLEASAASQATA